MYRMVISQYARKMIPRINNSAIPGIIDRIRTIIIAIVTTICNALTGIEANDMSTTPMSLEKAVRDLFEWAVEKTEIRI